VGEIRRFYIDFLLRPLEEYQKFTAYTSPGVGVRVTFFVRVDFCSSQMNNFYSLHSLALTRMSFRDFPLQYQMMGGSLKIFLSCD